MSASVHAAVHPGTCEGQADRAGGDVWRGISEVQRAICRLLFVPRPAVASGYLH